MKRTTIRKIVNAMGNYFDADSIAMTTDGTGVSVTMVSNEAAYRAAHLNMVEDGPVNINVDYLIPDSTMTVRLWEIEFIGAIVSKFKPLSMDIAYPEGLIDDVKEILKGEKN